MQFVSYVLIDATLHSTETLPVKLRFSHHLTTHTSLNFAVSLRPVLPDSSTVPMGTSSSLIGCLVLSIKGSNFGMKERSHDDRCFCSRLALVKVLPMTRTGSSRKGWLSLFRLRLQWRSVHSSVVQVQYFGLSTCLPHATAIHRHHSTFTLIEFCIETWSLQTLDLTVSWTQEYTVNCFTNLSNPYDFIECFWRSRRC